MLMYPDAAHLLHDETQRTSESSTHTHSAQFEANSKAFTWYHQDMGSGLYLQKGDASSWMFLAQLLSSPMKPDTDKKSVA